MAPCHPRPLPLPPPLPPRPAHSFNAAAAQYAADRPSYPSALFGAIEDLTGRPLKGARVADIGAGTGIATALLHARRGARVLAVEPGAGMAAQLRRTFPDIPLVRGNGNALPLGDASVDLITYAQAWHWTDPDHALPEALRVLRPGGALALWWNIADPAVPWIAAQGERLHRHFGTGTHGASLDTADRHGLPPTHHLERRSIPWSRHVPLDIHLANLGSHSAFLVGHESAARAFLTAERTTLLKVFPDAMIKESYVVDLCLTSL